MLLYQRFFNFNRRGTALKIMVHGQKTNLHKLFHSWMCIIFLKRVYGHKCLECNSQIDRWTACDIKVLFPKGQMKTYNYNTVAGNSIAKHLQNTCRFKSKIRRNF